MRSCFSNRMRSICARRTCSRVPTKRIWRNSSFVFSKKYQVLPQISNPKARPTIRHRTTIGQNLFCVLISGHQGVSSSCSFVKVSLVFFKVIFALSCRSSFCGHGCVCQIHSARAKTRRVWPIDAATASSNWVQILHGKPVGLFLPRFQSVHPFFCSGPRKPNFHSLFDVLPESCRSGLWLTLICRASRMPAAVDCLLKHRQRVGHYPPGTQKKLRMG